MMINSWGAERVRLEKLITAQQAKKFIPVLSALSPVYYICYKWILSTLNKHQ
jgi:hypothetical protein